MPRKSIFEQYMTRKQTGAGMEIKGCPRCSSGGLLLSQLGSGCQVHARLRSRNPCWKTLSCLYLGRVLARLPSSAWQDQTHFKAASSAEAAKKTNQKTPKYTRGNKSSFDDVCCVFLLIYFRVVSAVRLTSNRNMFMSRSKNNLLSLSAAAAE